MLRLASLDDLLLPGLQDTSHAERQVLNVLPRMIQAASHPQVRYLLEDHRRQAENQIARLEHVSLLLGASRKGGKCAGMAGVLQEAEQIMEADVDAPVLDPALISAAQKIERYEIAGYGSTCSYAEMLGYDQAHDLLGQNLDEEETAGQKLIALTERVGGGDDRDAEVVERLERGA